MPANQNNLVSINIARGLAALSVFVYHYGVGPVLAKYTGVAAFGWVGYPGANFGVTLFFVISGFCIHGSEWRRLRRKSDGTFDLKGYGGRRFRRIYPVYTCALLLSCVISGINSEWPSLTDVGVHALLLHGFSAIYFNSINLVLWTISVEAFFYLIYPLWLKYRLKAGLIHAFVVGTVLSILSCVVTARFLYPFDYPARWFFLTTWGGWLGGAVMAETMETHAGFYRSWKWWLPGILAWLLGSWAEAGDFYSDRWLILKFPIRICLCAWPLSAFVLLENCFVSARGVIGGAVRVLSWIGLSSYSLYLLHEPLIDIRNLLQNAVSFGQFKLAFQVLWFFVVLGICWLSYRFVEVRFMRGATKRNEIKVGPLTAL